MKTKSKNIMEKKQYEKPVVEVIWLLQQTALLAGSSVTATIGDFEEEVWTPDPGSPEMDFSDTLDESLF